MTSDAWVTFGNVASATGLTAFAFTGVKGAVAGYQTYNSPSTSLTESEKRLERVRSRLRGLSDERRKEITKATQHNSSECTSLEGLEAQLESLTDVYCRLTKRYDESTFPERHNPYSEFRKHVSKLENDARGLLNDTLTTTVPHINDMRFDSKIPRRTMETRIKRPSTSSSQSPDASFTPTTSPDADAIPMSRIMTIV